MQISEVAIAGGGIIGCAIARTLRRLDFRVTLIERGRVGREASSAAAGMLGVEAETERPLVLQLGRRSRALFPQVLEALRAETDLTVEYWRHGTLYLCFSAADAENLMQRLRAVGAEGQPLAVRQARALEPGISPRAESAWLFGDDARVDNAGLTAAYARAAGAVGCEIREGETVDRVAVERGRVVGVETRAGRIACDAFVNAAGAWAGSLAAGLGIPVTPVRGQMVVLNTRQPAFRHAIYSRRGYAVTRRDGRLLLGSTREPVGFDRRVTGGGVRRIVGAALELSPQLGTAPLQECWSGLRPATPDGLPIIGFDPTVTGYMVASGHYRNGILLAPITAQLVADLFRGRTDPIMAHIGLDRFQSGPIGADD